MKTETRKIICTCCPMGCHMEVTLKDGDVENVVGNTCNRGKAYAVDECLHPRRTLTTTVKTAHGAMLPVKTAQAIPKEKLFAAMDELRHVTVRTPIRIGDVVAENVAGTGIAVIAAKNITD